MSFNVSFAIPENDIEPVGGNMDAEVLNVDDIGVAIDCGSIKSKYGGGNGKVVVHIQDAHCNFEAQSNINRILEQLTKECGIRMISVEGAEGVVDTAWFRAFPDAEIRKEVATYFMKKGEITGAEFFSINSEEYEGIIYGAETRDYYIKNLKAFTRVYPYKDSIENYISNVKKVSDRLKTIVYSSELKVLDDKISAFQDKEIELSEYAAFLAKKASENGVDIKERDDFTKLLQTLEYENKIDFDIVDKERSDYIDALSEKLDKEQMTELVAESIRFKKGHIKAVDFYSYLREKARETEIDIIHDYPNLFYYYIYTKLYEGIDNEDLFRDIDAVERDLKDGLFENATQRKLDRYAEFTGMFINLINIELTNDDYDKFQTYRENFSLGDVINFFSALSGRYGLNYAIHPLPVQVNENIPSMIDFYEIAMKRDEALINNTLNKMKEQGEDRCVLIAGGFHTRGMKRLLENKGVSYVVVTPKITKDVETPYIKVLTNQRTSLEDIITESAAMPDMGITASREEILRPKSDMLSPLNKVFYTINLLLEDRDTLREISDQVGDVNGRTVMDSAEESYADMVNMLVTEWLVKQKNSPRVRPEEWNELLDEWKKLRGAFQQRVEKLDDTDLNQRMMKSIIEAFRSVFEDETSPGKNAVRTFRDMDSFADLTPEEMGSMDEIIRGLMEQGAYQEPVEMAVSAVDGATGNAVTDTIEVIRLNGFREAMEEFNMRSGARMPMDVMVHPGTGKGQYKRMYLDSRMYDALDAGQLQRLADHEYYHILNPQHTEDEAMGAQEDDLRDVRDVLDSSEKARLEKRNSINKALINNSEAMAEAAEEGIGPDVTIIVATSKAEADFWQDRLTGRDDMHGSGAVVKKDAIVLAITEENWDGAAGNGLGTLNGFIQAARKAADFDLLEGVSASSPVEELLEAFTSYIEGKATFMYHTAGKGTRTAPLPGAEINSKPNIKLPRMLNIEGDMEPITILESVLMQTGVYAQSRKNRMGVFWGDQVIVNENEVDFDGKHHVEIFGQLVPLDEDIKAYGVLLPGQEGDAKQREKLPLEEVRELLPEGAQNAYKSIGSFTVSLAFLKNLILSEADTLKTQSGKLDTDPDWWQPLTSTKEEYIAMMDKKGKDTAKAATQWEKMRNLWEQFTSSEDFERSGLDRKVGYTDVGENSLWWDYGQNKYFLRNMQLLTEHSAEGRAARIFFGITLPTTVDEEELIREYAEATQWVWATKSRETKGAMVEALAGSLNVPAAELTPQDFSRPLDIFGGKDLEDLLGWARRATRAASDIEAVENLLDHIGVDSRGWISPDSTIAAEVEVDNSVIQNSSIKSGYLRNSVVINSDLEHVEAENAVIIGSTILSLSDLGGMVYNVVDDSVSVRQGQVYANAFHPDLGRLELRTTISRDGEYDFKKGPDGKSGAWVFDNTIRYAELNKANQGVSIEQANEVKQEYVEMLLREGTSGTSDAELPEILSDNRKIGLDEASMAVAHRMLVFGDRDSFTPSEYSDFFGVSIQKAREELDALAAIDREGTDLAGIWKTRDIIFDEEKADFVASEEPVYRAVPDSARADVMKDMPTMKFGTSGLRSWVEYMNDQEVYINTRGYVRFLHDQGELKQQDVISIVGDYRPSTPRLMKAIAQAVEDEAQALGYDITLDFGGSVSSPAGALRGVTKGSFAIVVTGSHIPFDMNGIKYYMRDGEEVLKKHEAPIYESVAEARAQEEGISWKASLFDEKGMFKEEPALDVFENEEEVREEYRTRYTEAFPSDIFAGDNVIFWKHSAVGAEDVDMVLEALGAGILEEEKDTEHFVPVDTEKVKPAMAEKLRGFAEKHAARNPKGIIFTDGDSDRPGVADENGVFLTGDKLGLLVTKLLKQGLAADEKLVVALPISTNKGVVQELERMGIDVIKTKIGSPHVVKAMNDAKVLAERKGEKIKTLGWEANGGYLLGSEFRIPGGGTLSRLATRDAMLPILATLMLARNRGLSLSELFEEEIPAYYNHTGGYENFIQDFGVDREGAMEIRKGIVAMLTPDLADKKAVAVDFEKMTVEKLVEAEIDGERVTTFQTGEEPIAETDRDFAEWDRVRKALESVFTPEKGFADIKGINVLDGIQVIFANNEVSHIRPSGNDPVFRNYAMSPVSQERAVEIATMGESEIIPGLAREVAGNMALTGVHAVRTMPSESTPEGRLVRALVKGEAPFKIKPYVQPKGWGVDGKGEYWYGAEAGDKSSQAVSGEDTAAMADILEYAPEELLGEDAVNNFGVMMPLTKILTPRSRLSMQFHDAKNEIWIVTGIDNRLAGEKPSIVLGFSYEAVSKYGREVNTAYGKALKKFGEDLNSLREHLETTNIKALEQEGDIIKAAKVDGTEQTRTLLNDLLASREGIEFFYNYRQVKVGDVVSIPAGTLHALGAGIEVLEPQIAGPTQSLEDGATWPVRYAFPGHETKTSTKVLDIDRVGEMIPDVVMDETLEVISSTDNYKVERLPGGFEDKGLKVERITLKNGAELPVDDNRAGHVLAVVNKGGIARVEINGEMYDIPQAKSGEQLMMIPATVKSYRIIAEADTQIVDTTMPDVEKNTILLPEDEDDIADTGVTPRQDRLSFQSFGDTTNVFERLTVIDSSPMLPILREREHRLRVVEGGIKVVDATDPEEVIAVASAGQEVDLPGDVDYRILSTEEINAEVDVLYEKTEEEKIVYTTYDTVSKYVFTVFNKPIDIIMPKQMFTRSGVGSREMEERLLNEYVEYAYKKAGREDAYQALVKEHHKLIRVISYNAEESLGLSEAGRLNIREGAKGILVATETSAKQAEKAAPEGVRELLAGQKGGPVQLLTVADVAVGDHGETLKLGQGDKGWFFTREIEYTAAFMTAITKESIDGRQSIAEDFKRLMSQLTGKKIGWKDLKYFLSYDNLKQEFTNPLSWLAYMVNNLLLKMPIKPFDPSQELEQRRKVMWSV
jgi:phosphomannomutase